MCAILEALLAGARFSNGMGARLCRFQNACNESLGATYAMMFRRPVWRIVDVLKVRVPGVPNLPFLDAHRFSFVIKIDEEPAVVNDDPSHRSTSGFVADRFRISHSAIPAEKGARSSEKVSNEGICFVSAVSTW